MWKRIIVVVAIQSAGSVVLVRNPSGFRREWQLPGGVVDKGEPGVTAAARKIVEEVGLNPHHGKLVYQRKIIRPKQIVVVFSADFQKGALDTLQNVGPNGHAIQKVPIANVKDILTPGDLELLP